MPQLFTNNATSTLAADITNVTASLTVASGHGARFPSIASSGDYFLVTLEKSDGTREIVKVTARSGDVLSGLVRAQEGTTAVAFSTGDTVELRVTAETMNAFARVLTTDAAGAAIENSTTQSIPTGTDTALTFNTELRNTDGFFTPSQPSRLTVPAEKAGWYVITATMNWAALAGSGRRLYLRLNGSKRIASASTTAASDHNNPYLSVSAVQYLAVGDYVETVVNQNSGSSVNTAVGVILPQMAIASLAPTVSTGGGGGAALAPIYTKYDPFCPPAAPSSLDDEFTVDQAGTPAGWTLVAGAGSALTRRGKLVMTSAANAAYAPTVIEKALPSGPFTILTHAELLGRANFHNLGLTIRSTASGRAYDFRVYTGPSSDPRILNMGPIRLNSYTSENSGVLDVGAYSPVMFLRIVYDGTTLYFDKSYDGTEFYTLHSEAIGTWFTGGNLPDQMGLQVEARNGTITHKGVFSFFRYAPTAFADLGRNVGVGSDGALLDPMALYLHNKVI